jgi:DNA-binding MarR family transcriptional regulator
LPDASATSSEAGRIADRLAEDGDVPTERERLIAELVQESRLLTRQLLRYYDAMADQLGLHISDLTCLLILRDRGRAGVGQLATELGLTTGAVSRMVNRLERTGFVRRTPDPDDRRRVTIELTSPSAAVGLFASQAANITEAAANLTTADLRLLLRYTHAGTSFSRAEADRLRREGKPHATRNSAATHDARS